MARRFIAAGITVTAGCAIRSTRYPYYLNSPIRRERDVFRVVFRDGSVVLIEQDSRS